MNYIIKGNNNMRKLVFFLFCLLLPLTLTVYSHAEDAGNTSSFDFFPTEEHIINCLQETPNVLGVAPVTEDNDPNDGLQKEDGYYSAVYFFVNLIDPDTIYGDTLIDKGTDAGGCVEAYRNVEDAIARDSYLSKLDKFKLLNPGSHSVFENLVIRTSKHLSQAQQIQLEKNIVAALFGIGYIEEIPLPEPVADNIYPVTPSPSPIGSVEEMPLLELITEETPSITSSLPSKSISNEQSIPNIADENVEEEAPISTVPPKATPAASVERKVWIPKSGSKYHSRPGCSNMENPSEISESEAKNRGFTACKRCF